MVVFEDLPSTDTPLNASNLNNNFNELNEKTTEGIKLNTFSAYNTSSAWYKILTYTGDSAISLKVIGGSTVGGLEGRGNFEVLISSGTNNNSATIIYGTKGINTTNFKFIDKGNNNYELWFKIPQFTYYKITTYRQTNDAPTTINFNGGVGTPSGTEIGFFNNSVGVVESGENSNGSYIKYADGTMVCTSVRTFPDLSFTSPWGSLYETTSQSLGSMPQSFVEIPIINATVVSTSIASSWAAIIEYIKDTNTYNYGYIAFARPNNTASATISVNITAIGRWM